MKTVAIITVSLILSACSALPTLSTVAPTFCSLATSAEARAAAQALIEKLPPGTDKDKALTALSVSNVSADAACILVKALEAKTVSVQ